MTVFHHFYARGQFKVLGSLKGSFLMLIMKVFLLGVGVGVGAELFRMMWGLLVVFNEFTPTFLECKGAQQSPEDTGL